MELFYIKIIQKLGKNKKCFQRGFSEMVHKGLFVGKFNAKIFDLFSLGYCAGCGKKV